MDVKHKKIAHRREPNLGNGYRLIASCECGWTTHTESWRADARKLLTAAFRNHKAAA